jgi:hypothetical protein
MIKGIFYQTSAATKFFIALFFVFFSFFFMYVVGIFVVQWGFNINIIYNPEVLQNYHNPETIKVLKFFQLIQSVGLFVLPPFIIAFFYFYSVKDFLRFKKIRSWYIIFLSIIVVLSFIPFSNLLSYINNQLVLPDWLNYVENWMRTTEENANTLTRLFLQTDTTAGLFYNILLIALVPAFGEELLFRGVFQRIFTEWFKSYHWGIWISAILFSFIHFQFFGFLPRLFLGIVFGYLLEYSGTILLPILAHFVNNLTGVLIAYFVSAESIINNSTQSFSFIEFIYAMLGGLVGSVCMWLISRKANRIL